MGGGVILSFADKILIGAFWGLHIEKIHGIPGALLQKWAQIIGILFEIINFLQKLQRFFRVLVTGHLQIFPQNGVGMGEILQHSL